MAIQTLNTIKNWFKTSLKPTQQQFWDTWDSFRHKFEKVPVKDVENLEQILNEKAEKSQLDLHTNNQLAHAALFTAKEDKNQKGIAGGYAPLNNFTKLASQYLDIINDLVSGGTDSILSAEQGKILQNQIDDIHSLLQSDNVNLDTLQEIVNAIGEIELSLNTILVNDLTTGGATKALTAEMGKLLQSSKEDKSQKGVSGGYAPLNDFTKLASQYLDIVNDLVSGGSTSLLSAEQGKILQNQINVINTLLVSDDINLDTLQEIVNAIKDIQGLSTIIVNDLTAGGTDKALSAQMGKNLNEIKANLSGAAFTGAVSGIDPVNGNEFVTKQFAEGLLIGVVRFIAYYNPNAFSNQYPSSGGSGTGGTIKKGDTWIVNGLGVGVTVLIGTKLVNDGDRVTATSDNPIQDETKWSIGEANLGFTPANDANILHKTGNESWTGQKTSASTNSETATRLQLINNFNLNAFGVLFNMIAASGSNSNLMRMDLQSAAGGKGLEIISSSNSTVKPFSLINVSTEVMSIDKSANMISSGTITLNTNRTSPGESALIVSNTGTQTGIRLNSTTGTNLQSTVTDGTGISASLVGSGNALTLYASSNATGNLINGRSIFDGLITNFIDYKYQLTNGGSYTNAFLVSRIGDVTAKSYKIIGGSSNQYLMADGSVSTLTNSVTGTGTTNYVPKFTGRGAIGDSKIIDQGTGEVQFYSTDNSNFGFLNTMSTSLNIGSFKAGTGFQDVNIIGTSGATNVIFKADGNVGIGTTAPNAKFHSNGGAITTSNEFTYSGAFSNNSNKAVVIGYDTVNNVGHIGSINPLIAWTDLSFNINGGNVGIGKKPTSKFDVSLGGDLNLKMLASGTSSELASVNDGNNYYYDLSINGANILFKNNNTVSARISSSGNVSINSLAGTGDRLVKASSTGELSASTLVVESNTYTPTLTIQSNLSILQLSSQSCNTYIRVGNIVTVTISGSYQPTASNSLCVFRFTLPINKSTLGVIDIGTSISSSASPIASFTGYIRTNSGTNNEVIVAFTPTNTSVGTFIATVQYDITK